MKKYVVFLYGEKPLERMAIDSFNLESIEIIKTDVAFNHNILRDDIDVQVEDEASANPSANYYIDASGMLMLNSPIKDRQIEGVRQAYPMGTAEEINWFLENFNGDLDCLLYLKTKSL